MTIRDFLIGSMREILPELIGLRDGLRITVMMDMLGLYVLVSVFKENRHIGTISLPLDCALRTSAICERVHAEIWEEISTWKPKAKKPSKRMEN